MCAAAFEKIIQGGGGLPGVVGVGLVALRLPRVVLEVFDAHALTFFSRVTGITHQAAHPNTNLSHIRVPCIDRDRWTCIWYFGVCERG